MQSAAPFIITQRDVKRSSRFHYAHHEALGEGSCAGTLLNDLTFFQNLEGLFTPDASLLRAEQGVVVPSDTTSLCSGANLL